MSRRSLSNHHCGRLKRNLHQRHLWVCTKEQHLYVTEERSKGVPTVLSGVSSWFLLDTMLHTIFLNISHATGQKAEGGNPAPLLLMNLLFKGRSSEDKWWVCFLSKTNNPRASPRRASYAMACHIHTKWTCRTLRAPEELHTARYKIFPFPTGNLDCKSWPGSKLKHQQQAAVGLHSHSEPPAALTCSFTPCDGGGSIWSWKTPRRKIHPGCKAGRRPFVLATDI